MSTRADIFEKSGRKEQIEALLSREFSTPVKLKLETAVGEQTQTESGTTTPKTGSQRRNEIVNDPAVKTVLMGLDATITGIEEAEE
jgi:polynucleotide 5'-kinase involved in rRNA processing